MSTTPTQRLSLRQRLSAFRPNPSVLLFIATIIAVTIANSSWNARYLDFLHYPVQVIIGGIELFRHMGHTMTISQVVNDALMAIFFFVVGLEIKQELLVGELASPKKALLPVIAALGGMLFPVLFFLLITPNHPESIGAAIPMATDIAFALAVLSALGARVPKSLYIFLATLAVADDIGGIIVIALFYSKGVALLPLVIGLILVGFVLVLGRLRVHTLEPYIIAGIAVWALFLQSGIHPTIAGVLVALCIPAGTKVHIRELSRKLLEQTSHLLGLPLAILMGLFLGKTVGISLFTYIAIRVKLCDWPEGMNLPRLISLSVLGGIGFTVSLFIANLAYDAPDMAQLLNEAKLGIFAGTIVSGVVGYALLHRFLPASEGK